MITRKNYELYLFEIDNKIRIIREGVNELISALYIPSITKKEGYHLKPDYQRFKRFKINLNEPFNLIDLKCVSIERTEKENSFNVYIEEASPYDCPTLCDYIKRYMASAGWDVTSRFKRCNQY